MNDKFSPVPLPQPFKASGPKQVYASCPVKRTPIHQGFRATARGASLDGRQSNTGISVRVEKLPQAHCSGVLSLDLELVNVASSKKRGRPAGSGKNSVRAADSETTFNGIPKIEGVRDYNGGFTTPIRRPTSH